MNAALPPQALVPDSTDFVDGPLDRPPLRAAVTATWRTPETELLPGLVAACPDES